MQESMKDRQVYLLLILVCVVLAVAVAAIVFVHLLRYND
jgi:uncharacterized membrane protein YwzB